MDDGKQSLRQLRAGERARERAATGGAHADVDSDNRVPTRRRFDELTGSFRRSHVAVGDGSGWILGSRRQAVVCRIASGRMSRRRAYTGQQ